jgi:hypothetical protein
MLAKTNIRAAENALPTKQNKREQREVNQSKLQGKLEPRPIPQ